MEQRAPGEEAGPGVALPRLQTHWSSPACAEEAAQSCSPSTVRLGWGLARCHGGRLPPPGPAGDPLPLTQALDLCPPRVGHFI